MLNIATVMQVDTTIDIMELAAIQIMLFGIIILVYMAEEFNK